MINSHPHALHFKDNIAKFKEIWKTNIIMRGILKREKLDKSFVKYLTLKNVVMYGKIMHWSSVILRRIRDYYLIYRKKKRFILRKS